MRVSVMETVQPLPALWAKGVVEEHEGTDRLGISLPRQGEFDPAALIFNAGDNTAGVGKTRSKIASEYNYRN